MVCATCVLGYRPWRAQQHQLVVAVLFLGFLLHVAGGQAVGDLVQEQQTPPTAGGAEHTTRAGEMGQDVTIIEGTAKSKFDAKGMGPLYDITNLFLVLITPNSFPRDVAERLVNISKEEQSWESLEEEGIRKQIIDYELGFLICAAVGAVYVMAMLITGLLFCCCRMCGRCGTEQGKMDGRHGPCKRVCYGIFLCLSIIVMLFGVVCTFVTNEYVDQAATDLPSKLNQSVADLVQYADNTQMEVEDVLVNDYQSMVYSPLTKQLDDTGDDVLARLGAITGAAVGIANLTDISNYAARFSEDLTRVDSLSGDLRLLARNLTWALFDIRNKIAGAVGQTSDCPPLDDVCRKIVDASYDFYVGPNFARLTNVEAVLDNVRRVVDNDLQGLVSRGNETYQEISMDVRRETDEAIREAKLQLSRVGSELVAINNDVRQLVSDSLGGLTASQSDQSSEPQFIADLQSYIEENRYGRWIGVAMSSVLALIVICFLLGIMCGICGRRPGSGGGGCNWGTGATCLMAGTVFAFLFCWLLMVITMVMFLIGGHVHVIGCEPLLYPELSNSPQVELFDDLLSQYQKESGNNFNITLTDLLQKCENDTSIYKVLNLESNFKLSEIQNFKNKYNLTGVIDSLSEDLQVEVGSPVILSEAATRELISLAESGADSLNFTSDLLELARQIVVSRSNPPMTLTEFSQLLTSYAQSEAVVSQTQREDILLVADSVRDIQDHWIARIETTINALGRTLRSINIENNLEQKVFEIIDRVRTAEGELSINGTQMLLQVVKQRSQEMLDQVNSYITHIVFKVEYDVGNCGDALIAFDNAVVAVCQDFLYPFNGFWAAMGCCLLFFIPFSIILAVKLAGLYRKSEKFIPVQGHSDSDLDYERAYGDTIVTNGYNFTDDIPLHSAPPKSRHKQRSSSHHDVHGGYEHNAYADEYYERERRRKSRPPSESRPPHERSRSSSKHSGDRGNHWHYHQNGHVLESPSPHKPPPPYNNMHHYHH